MPTFYIDYLEAICIPFLAYLPSLTFFAPEQSWAYVCSVAVQE